MDDTLGDALVVEMGELVAQHEIFEQSWPTGPGAQPVLIVADDVTEGRGEAILPLRRDLMQFTAVADLLDSHGTGGGR